MSINPTNGSGGALVDLANQIFRQVDGNSDGKLNQNEFQSFLQGLLSQLGNRTNGLGSESTSVRTASMPPNGYEAMVGFNFEKLNNLGHTTPKYVFARATQNVTGLGFTRASRSAGLTDILQDVRANGYPDAVQTGDDTIDFGDGYGPIDVLTSDGQWWWGPEGN